MAVVLAPSFDHQRGARCVGGLLTVALPALLCVGLLLVMGHGATETFARSGSASYALIADELAASGFYSIDGVHHTAIRPPAYPLFLWIAKVLGGNHWAMAALVAQGAVAVTCLILTALIAHRLFADPRATAASVVLLAGNVWLLREFFILRETGLFTLLTLLFVWLAFVPMREAGRAALLGVVTALALLTRPSGLVFLPVSALVLVYLVGPVPLRLFRVLTVYFIAFAACVAPWQIYLYQTFGRISLTGTSTSGMNLFKGNHPLMGEIYKLADVDKAEPQIVGLAERAGLIWERDRWSVDDHLGRLARESIVRDPGRFLRRAAEKAVAFFSPANVPVGRRAEVHLKDGELVVHEAEVAVGGARVLYHLFVLPLGLLGLAAAVLVPGRRLWGLSVGALLAGNMLTYAVTFPETRFRFPLEPLLALAAIDLLRGLFENQRLPEGGRPAPSREERRSLDGLYGAVRP